MKLKKYIICDSARAESGKTAVLSELADKLKSSKNIKQLDFKDLNNGDVWYLFECKGKKICIITGGDDAKSIKKWLDWSMKANADIVVCASRSKGDTVHCVNEFASKSGFSIVKFSNYFCEGDDSEINVLNECTAESILNVIEKLLNIKF